MADYERRIADTATGDGVGVDASMRAGSPMGQASKEQFALAMAGGTGVGDPEEETLSKRPYNQRIELPGVDDLSDLEGDRFGRGGRTNASDDGVHDLDEDEFTRMKVKKASSQVSLLPKPYGAKQATVVSR